MSLGAQLTHRLKPGFFRLLSRPSWPVYVDVADHLLESADEGGQVSREDALTLIRDVVAGHPQIEWEGDEGAQFSDVRQKATQLFNRMLDAGWLHERRLSIDETWVLITPPMRWLVRLLRELTKSDVVDFKDFAATLRSLCRDLLEPPSLDPGELTPEAMRQAVGDLLARATQAGDQMHAVEALILDAENEQRTSVDAAETLSRFLVDFHAGEHMVCYNALQEGGLIPRLLAAKNIVLEAAASPLAKDRLANGLLASGKALSADAAYTEAEKLLRRLERSLATIPAKQRIIDGRMADFSRLSAQRYRYQTEMRGRRPEQVKAFMDTAGVEHAGARFGELERAAGMPLLSPAVAIHFGSLSLAPGRKPRPRVNLDFESPGEPGDDSLLDAQDAIRRHNLYMIAPQRAARFFESRSVEPGETISTADLEYLAEDDWLDLLAVLAFDNARRPGTRKTVRWKIHSARQESGLIPEQITQDPVAGYHIERVVIERVA